jgi:anhydro-N-acetylmuramic acid kinase
MSKMLSALGLMSGTSLDGIDVALLRTDGENVVERGPAQTFAYDAAQQDMLRNALSEAATLKDRRARPGVLADVERHLTQWHVDAVLKFLKNNNLSADEIDVVGFHGQTVLHRPEMKLTVQLGDGRALAKAIGIDVVYDMRAADVAAGGQGAPLVPVYHRALANSFPTAFVNIGGVANVTYIGADGALLAFDTGPGNAMINDWMMKHRAVGFDDGGSAALKGKISTPHLEKAMAHPFFKQKPPKSLDRNSFAALDFTALDFEDGSATLAGFTVEAIAASQSWFPQKPVQWVICGGGRHNGAIMHGLRDKLGGVVSAEDVMLKGDAMEAEAWAYLAVRSLKGLAITFPGTTGVAQPMNGGVILKP